MPKSPNPSDSKSAKNRDGNVVETIETGFGEAPQSDLEGVPVNQRLSDLGLPDLAATPIADWADEIAKEADAPPNTDTERGSNKAAAGKKKAGAKGGRV